MRIDKDEHKAKMKIRRMRQLARRPDKDARLAYFSKNSLPEYRKEFVHDFTKNS